MVSRRMMIGGGAGAAVLAALGYRAWDRGVFASGEGPAFEAWQDWQGHAGEGTRRPLHAAILAASAHNTQPWMFEPHEDSITVYADLSRNLGAADPFRRELHQSVGCAIHNLVLAANYLGFEAVERPVPGRLDRHPGTGTVKVSEIALVPNETIRFRTPALTVQAVAARHTNRGPYFADRPVDAVALEQLFGHYGPDLRVVAVHDKAARQELGAMIVAATEAFIADHQMAADSARWFRTGRREILAHRDGVTTDAAGLSPLMTAASKLLPDLDAAEADKYWLAATRDTQVPTAALFGIILVRDRLDIEQAIAAGQAWQSLHLLATVHGIAAQPLNQPLEMIDRNEMVGRADAFKRDVMKLVGVSDWEPAFVFRLGYAKRLALPSPRRPLDDVIRRTGFA